MREGRVGGDAQMHAECGRAQTEGKMCLPRRAERCIDAQCPTFKCSTNEAPMTSDIVTRDMSIDQRAAHVFFFFNDSLNYFY